MDWTSVSAGCWQLKPEWDQSGLNGKIAVTGSPFSNSKGGLSLRVSKLSLVSLSESSGVQDYSF